MKNSLVFRRFFYPVVILQWMTAHLGVRYVPPRGQLKQRLDQPKSTGLFSLKKAAVIFSHPGIRQCGIAIPSPIPVLPRRSLASKP